MWPKAALPGHNNPPPPTLSDVVTTLRTLGKTELPKQLARWLDELDETGRWALLKLVTGAMRIGISARLGKTAAANLGDKDPHDIELMWPGLSPPYLDLFAWLEGRAEKPVKARSRTVPSCVDMSSACHRRYRLRQSRCCRTSSRSGNGTAFACRRCLVATNAVTCSRGFIQHTGEDITKSFPGPAAVAASTPARIDGELLVLRDSSVQTFNVLQQRLNRKVVSPKLIEDLRNFICAPTICSATASDDLRELPFAERRARLEAFVKRLDDPRIDLSPTGRLRELGAADRRARRSRQRRARARMPMPWKA